MNKFIFMLLSLFLFSCSTSSHQIKKSVDRLTIAAQPSKAQLEKVSKDGFEIVINLRSPGEFKDFKEEEYVKELSLDYYNLPFFNKDKSINKSSIEQISQIVNINSDKKIFLHCSSGNRAAAWYLIHLHKNEGYTVYKAIVEARKKGLTKAPLEKKVINFLKN
ncbi:hypothetical protein [Flavobacterium alkalisoli]|uniref:hypothetical protein n=1 Tax=Flavobacterium alkalisoli TaxID=2602769 RepID=UPI003A8EA32B